MDNSGATDKSISVEYTSAALTVGSGAGNIRSDAPSIYTVQFSTTGAITDSNTQRATVENARLLIKF